MVAGSSCCSHKKLPAPGLIWHYWSHNPRAGKKRCLRARRAVSRRFGVDAEHVQTGHIVTAVRGTSVSSSTNATRTPFRHTILYRFG